MYPLFVKYRTLVLRLIGAAVRRRAKRWLNLVKVLFFLVILPFELVGDVLFLWRRLWVKKVPGDVRKILIAKPDQMGDVLFTTFLLPHLHAQFPDARIDYLIHEKTKPILEGNPYVSGFHYFGQFSIGVFLGRSSGGIVKAARENMVLALHTLRALRAERYDIIINARAYPPSNNWLLARARPRYLVSYDISSFSFCAHAWARYDLKDTEASNAARLIEALGVPMLARGSAGGVQDSSVEFHNFAPVPDAALTAEPYVVISPVTFDVERSVPDATWVAVIKYLTEDLHLRVIMTAIPLHEPYIAGLRDKSGAPDRITLATNLNLPQLASLMRGAKLVLSIDSFPAFLAVAVGAPTISFYNNEYWFVPGLPTRVAFPEGRSLIPVGHTLLGIYPITVAPEIVLQHIRNVIS